MTTSIRPQDIEATLEVMGENGYMVLGGVALNKIEKYSLKKTYKFRKKLINNSNEKVENGLGNSHKIVLDKIIKSIKYNKNNFPINALESYHTENLIHAMYKSDEEKKWIKINKINFSKRLGKNYG